ncbi:hypothetical protein [Clostridium sp. BNL1100]|uniref:hypothetical protein n=1 Tax=Clostridium sp. BNL1100 TaxID=755731 RepID=UPI00024A72A2|nr:hypothetical protein [Clostridium sp. BNL1100]AEY66347.1 hypothetical protein Clo1100_2164 [Clostridium sp. BNL1100]
MLIDINWEEFFSGGSFEDISNGENRVWIVVIDQDPFSSSILSETVFEINNAKRNELLASDRYLRYKYNRTDSENGDRNSEGVVTLYIFKSKIIDSKGNLILICDIEQYEFGGSELIEAVDIDLSGSDGINANSR